MALILQQLCQLQVAHCWAVAVAVLPRRALVGFLRDPGYCFLV